MANQCCVLIFILPWVHLIVVHYLHLLSTQISADECCSKYNTLWCPYRKLLSRQKHKQKHPTLNGEQKTSTTLLFNNYNPTTLQYGSTAGAVVSIFKKNSELSSTAWLCFFHYVDKMAAVECVKCTSLHTQVFAFMRATSGSFRYTSFRRNRYRNTLSTQTKYSKYGKYGYRNTCTTWLRTQTSITLTQTVN